MEKSISSFFSAPHFEAPKQANQAEILNRIIAVVMICGLLGLVITLATIRWSEAICFSMLLVLSLMSKIILQQRRLRFASFFFLGSLSFFNMLFSTLLPEWPILGISLAFVSVIAILLLDLRWTMVIYGVNVLGYLFLTLPSWAPDINQLFQLGWIALAVFLTLIMINLYIKTSLKRDSELLNLCDRFEQDNTQLKAALEDTKAQLMGEIENRKTLEMHMQDELTKDSSHRFNPQTGMYMEKAVLEMIEQEISRTRRYQRPLSLLCVRVDDLLRVVEKAGLTPGKLLSMLSDTFNESLRREDILGHFGSDGFYILLPETGRYASYVVAERLRHLVEIMSLFNAEEGTKLSISIGLTAYQDQGKMDVEIFTGQAKEALASAEQHGGNWTISWHDLSHTPV